MSMLSPYTNAALTAQLVANDLHYMHYMVTGEDFDKSHLLAGEYYEQLGEEVDYLFELALEVGQPIVNPTLAGTVVEGYVPESGVGYDYATLVDHITSRIAMYVASLKVLRSYAQDESIQSKIDDMVRGWEKELYYKQTRRGGVVDNG